MVPPQNRRLIYMIFGFILGVFGLFFGIFSETILNYMLERAMILRPNTFVFNLWRSPPLKIALDFYMFNWTNPQDFFNLSSKPMFTEMGPYRFIEKADKFDFQWHPENGTVTYSKKSRYYFDAEGSNGSLSDRLIIFNALLMAAASKSRNWGPWRRAMGNIALQTYNYDTTLNKTVGEMLFEGFFDELVDLGNRMPSSLTGLIIPFDRIGFCYGRNNTARFQGHVNMYTGQKDFNKIGQVYTWNNRTSTGYFPGECGRVKGSGGEFQPPYQKENGSISIFLPDICRPVTLHYDKKVVYDGIHGYRYHGGLRTMDNGSLYPDNACYCNGECLRTGVMNLTSCIFDVPIFGSFPHFYNADPYYLEQIEGLKPVKEKHEMYMLIDPRTGFAFKMAGRVQMNVLIKPVPYLTALRKVRKILFPLLWIDLKAELTPELSNYLRAIPKIILAGHIFGGLCFAIGLWLVWWQPVAQLLKRRTQHMQIRDFDTTKNKDNESEKHNLTITPEDAPLLQNISKTMAIRTQSLGASSANTMSEELSTSGQPSMSASINST